LSVLVKLFKVLGEPTRLKIIRLLAEKELCICDIEEIMNISQPRVSQHLKILKQAGIVNERKDAQKHICTLNKQALNQFMNDFASYLQKPLDQIEDMKEEYARYIHHDGKGCERKMCE